VNAPRIVTQLNPAGVPTSYSISNVGFYDAQFSLNLYLKQAFSDFLGIRHGANMDPSGTYNLLYFGSTTALEAPFRSLTYPDINATVMRPAFPTLNQTLLNHGITKQDAGVKNVDLVTRTVPFAQATPYYPPAIPPRRLFQIPDKDANSSGALTLPDPFLVGYTPPAAALIETGVRLTSPPAFGSFTTPEKLLDNSEQHPYYRSEWLQKMMNLSTVRTHQYAVWVTVGFFEVTTAGDAATGTYDVIGREVGTLKGKDFRHRAFFIVDRLKLGGFDPRSPGQYQDAVLYRKIIQ
jgi:hypothetical protein